MLFEPCMICGMVKFLALSLLVLLPVSADYLSQWSGWSTCSRTCDGGASYQLRRCTKGYVYKGVCEDARIRYRTCNNKLCGLPPGQFRERQCSAYNDVKHNDRSFHWHTHADPLNPCALTCQAEEANIIRVFAPKVLDGTRCNDISLNMCINGKCWPVGCDHVLGSTTKRSCGVCGGPEDCEIRKTTHPQKYVWDTAALSACSASCGVGVQVTAVICRDKTRKHAVDSELCDVGTRPMPSQNACFLKPCPAEWRVSLWQPCTKSCGEGISTRNVGCAQQQENRSLSWLAERQCFDVKPSGQRSCNTSPCPIWYAGRWSPCGVTCGEGVQRRAVVCRHIGTDICDAKTKPLTTKPCQTYIICIKQKEEAVQKDEPETVQQLSLNTASDVISFNIPRHPSIVEVPSPNNADVTSEPSFIVSEWSACSKSCGAGERTRYVRCKVYLTFMKAIADLPDIECPAPKPHTLEACNTHDCPSSNTIHSNEVTDFEEDAQRYTWQRTGFAPCSHTCLGGVQSSLAECVNIANESAVMDSYCSHIPPPVIQRKLCNEMPCPPRWSIGNYSICWPNCGAGLMIRKVNCIQEVAYGEDNVLPLPNFMCERPEPARNKSCFSQNPCPTQWMGGKWGKCSAKCGAGSRIRDIWCVEVLPDGSTRRATRSNHCTPDSRPLDIKTCRRGKCSGKHVRVKDDTSVLVQIRRERKVVVTVGGEAYILPGTHLTVKCPVIGIDAEDLIWYINGTLVHRRNKRIRQLRTGKLRMRFGHRIKSTLSITCIAGPKNSTILLHSQSFRAARLENKRRMSYARYNTVSGGGFWLKKDFGSKLQFVVRDWSSCSSRCGIHYGLRRRNVTCEYITESYYKRFLPRTCIEAGLLRPVRKVKCRPDKKVPCFAWTTGEWTDCQNSSCNGIHTAVRSRNVHCSNTATKRVANMKHCSELTRPEAVVPCRNIHCVPDWKKSSWTECSPDCGLKRFKSRTLSCIWSVSGQPASLYCRGLPLPNTLKICAALPCNDDCRDESKFCQMVRWMKMCRLPIYQSQCCQACSENNTL